MGEPQTQARFKGSSSSRSPFQPILQSLATTDHVGRSNLVVIVDDLESPFSFLIYEQALSEVRLLGSSKQAYSIVSVCVERDPSSVGQEPGSCAARQVIVDCHSDAFGCWSRCRSDDGDAGAPDAGDGLWYSLSGTLARPPERWGGELVKLCEDLPGLLLVTVDSVSPWIKQHGAHAVLCILDSLSRLPRVGAVLFSLHADLHAPQTLALFRRSAQSVMTVVAPPTTETGAVCRIRCETLRPRGGPKIETSIVCREGSALVFVSTSGSSMMSAATSKDAVPAIRPGVEPLHGVPQLTAGGMSLTLSEEELAARRNVALPYERQQQDKDLLNQQDARQYLPQAAGGIHGAESHILYVRDSDSEHDSDEDPDDELDL